jgi:hypothetical protein
MKRNPLIAKLLLIATFFLIILGMRNPCLDQDPSPKPRPRAVVQKTFKTAVVICGHLHFDAEVAPTIAVATLSKSHILFLSAICHTPALVQRFFPSRASPALNSIVA